MAAVGVRQILSIGFVHLGQLSCSVTSAGRPDEDRESLLGVGVVIVQAAGEVVGSELRPGPRGGVLAEAAAEARAFGGGPAAAVDEPVRGLLGQLAD